MNLSKKELDEYIDIVSDLYSKEVNEKKKEFLLRKKLMLLDKYKEFIREESDGQKIKDRIYEIVSFAAIVGTVIYIFFRG